MSRVRRASSGTFVVWLLVVAAVGFAVRLVYVQVVIHHGPLGQDATWYALTSGPLSDGLGYLAPGPFFTTGHRVATAGYPPGYPALLALVTRVVDGAPQTFRVAGCLTGTVTIVLTGLIGRRLDGERLGLVSATVVALLPSLVAVDGAVMSESLSVPLILLAALLAVQIVRSPDLWRWLLLGLVLGLVVLTRADGVVLLVILPVATVWAARPGWGRGLVAVAAAVLVAAATVVPWIVRNDHAVHTRAVATISSAATIAGSNCDRTYHGELIGSWAFSCMNAAAQTRMSEARWSRETTDRGVQYARAHLGRLPLVVAVRELRGFGLYAPRQQASLEAPEGRSEGWQLLANLVWLPIMLAAIAGVVAWIVRVRDQRELGPLLGVVLTSIVVIGIAHGNTRFRAFAEPILVIAGVQIVAAAIGSLTGSPTATAIAGIPRVRGRQL